MKSFIYFLAANEKELVLFKIVKKAWDKDDDPVIEKVTNKVFDKNSDLAFHIQQAIIFQSIKDDDKLSPDNLIVRLSENNSKS